jgi:hypothetical protein
MGTMSIIFFKKLKKILDLYIYYDYCPIIEKTKKGNES